MMSSTTTAAAAAAASTTTTSDTSSLAVPSGDFAQTILLDSDIRDWVVLPLLVIMIAAGLLRHYLSTVLRASPKAVSRIEQRARNDLQRATRIRGGSANFVSSAKWEARRAYYSSQFLKEEATWAQEEADKAPAAGDGAAAADLMNPMSMMEGMKGQMAFMVQNMVMMQGISHFFKGYVLVKIPFPLTTGFKGMFQRGLELQTLDTSYVSSVSWYFLVMFGLRAFFRLVIGDPSQEMIENGQSLTQMGMVQSVGPQTFDAPKALKTEADNLELMSKHKSSLDDVEKRLLGKRYPKKKLQADANDLFGGYGTTTTTTSKKKRQ